MSTYDFTGKTALVTGSTAGIGLQVAAKLAAGGAHVIVTGRDAARGEHAVQSIRSAGGTADFLAVDLADFDQVKQLPARAIAAGGGHVDILVNNAGFAPFASTVDTTEEMFDSSTAVNIKAPFFLVAALVPAMVERGSGAVVSVSTMVANYGMAGMPIYGATKAALQLLTKSWAAEFGASGVRFNVVSPGPTRTPGTLAMGDGLDSLAATTPSGRVSTAEEIADAVVFLASDAAAQIHGAILPVDGGKLAA